MPAKRNPLYIVVLAAGKGERMNSTVPKVLHEVSGKPMLTHVLEQVSRLKPVKINLVVSEDNAAIRAAAANWKVHYRIQKKSLGTAHAAMVGCAAIPAHACVLVVFGDSVLIDATKLRRMVNVARKGALALRTMLLKRGQPRGYSYLVRDDIGNVQQLILDRTGKGACPTLREADAGGMAFLADWGKTALAAIRPDGARREYNLTELVRLAAADQIPIKTVEVGRDEGLGINTPAELLYAEAVISRQQVSALQQKGVLFTDPDSVVIRGTLRAAAGVFIDRNVIFTGSVTLAQGASVGPNCVVADTVIAQNAAVKAFTYVDKARLGKGSQVGPFARLRPGSRIGARARVGNFVETKAVELGAGAKANHLAYLGDGRIGAGSNIGAGTVFCNYDGVNKHPTILGDNVFVGSGSMLVAPVEVGEGCLIAAGSVITKDVVAGEIGFGRARQRNLPAKKLRRKTTKPRK